MASTPYRQTSSRLEDIWRRFIGRPRNVVGFYFLLFFIFLSLANHLFRPDKSPLANTQHLELAKLKPLSAVKFLIVKKNTPSGAEETDDYVWVPIESYEVGQKRLKLKIRNTNGFEEYRFFNLVDVFYPVTTKVIERGYRSSQSEFDFTDVNGDDHTIRFQDLKDRLEKDAFREKLYLFGADQYGRDLISRLLAGSSISLGVGFLSVFISLILGLTIGVVSGYAGGMTDRILNWLMNVFYSIPAILLVIGITLITGTGVWGVTVGISAVLWVELARIIRGEVILLRQKEFVNAARLIGASDVRILIKHIIPNLVGPIIILSAGNFADAILMEAGLSFLGIGIQPPNPSWGGMIRELYGYIITDGAFLAIIPGLAIVSVVLTFLVVSNGLKEAIDFRGGERKVGG